MDVKKKVVDLFDGLFVAEDRDRLTVGGTFTSHIITYGTVLQVDSTTRLASYPYRYGL